jgi:hypothetical protein
METPEPQQISVSGRLVIEGQLPVRKSTSSENGPAPPSPRWWKFWRWPPETVLARTSVIASLATIVLAAGTIGLAVITHIASTEQARLTRESNEISRTAYTATQRAFVTVTDVKLVPSFQETGDVDIWHFAPIIENSGNTPTKNLRYLTGSGVQAVGTDAQTFARNVFSSLKHSGLPSSVFRSGLPRAVLGPKTQMSVHSYTGGMGEQVMNPVWSGNGVAVAAGFVEYDDVFSSTDHHVTEYCFIIGPQSKPKDTSVTFTLCQNHNCADEECEHEGDSQ